MQRLRIKFCRGEEIKFISHLDLMRLWQRALIRAGIPLAYSEGFSPHPRISLAAPLALGVTSESELMDIVTSRWVSPHWLTAALSQQLPVGIELLQAQPVPPTLPSLQSQTAFAEYRVGIVTEKGEKDVESAISTLLSLEQLPWQHARDTGRRNYDLRTLINDLWLIDCRSGHCTIGMRLQCDNRGSGRPEQVTAALGFTGYPESIHRTKLVMNVNRK